MEYQVVTLPSSSHSPDRLFPGLPETAVHAWNDPKYNSICLGFPLAPSSSSSSSKQGIEKGGIILPVVFPEGKLSEFRNQNGIEGYDEPLKSLFPDLSDETRNAIIAEQLRNGDVASGGTCVWCSSMGSPYRSVVLIG